MRILILIMLSIGFQLIYTTTTIGNDKFNYISGYWYGRLNAYYYVEVKGRFKNIDKKRLIELARITSKHCNERALKLGASEDDAYAVAMGCLNGFGNKWLVLKGRNMTPINSCNVTKGGIKCQEDPEESKFGPAAPNSELMAYVNGYHEGERVLLIEYKKFGIMPRLEVPEVKNFAAPLRDQCYKHALNGGFGKEFANHNMAKKAAGGCYDGYIDEWIDMKSKLTNKICIVCDKSNQDMCPISIRDKLHCVDIEIFDKMIDYD